MTDYRALAEELLELRISMHLTPAARKLTDLDKGTFLALSDLLGQGVVHPKELSRKMAISSARVAALLNHMEREGMVVRTADPGDNRQVIISLTAYGRQLIESRRSEAVRMLARALEELDPEEAESYLRIRRKLLNSFIQME